jgi:hypothetical protein
VIAVEVEWSRETRGGQGVPPLQVFMGTISNWLTHEDQKDLFEVVVALTLNILFLALIAPLLWLLGRPGPALNLAKGYGLLWIGTFVSAKLLNLVQRAFRMNIYDHPNAYVNSNLAVSCFLQGAWSVFAATVLNRFTPGASIWVVMTLYGIGLLSCFTAYFAVSSFFQGHIYKLVSLPLALVIFIIFSVWLAF